MIGISNPAIKKGSGIIMAVIGWFALILQLYVMLNTNAKNGIAPTTTVINFFSFFTILANLLVAISLTSSIFFPKSKLGIFFSKSATQSAIGLYIIIVGIVYSIALRKIWNPEGLQLVADRLLHDLIPLLYLFYWLLFTPKKVLQWKQVIYWLIFPAIYLAYSLIRGAVVKWYPYYFINAQKLGYGRVAVTALLVLAFFILFGLLLVFLNRIGKAER